MGNGHGAARNLLPIDYIGWALNAGVAGLFSICRSTDICVDPIDLQFSLQCIYGVLLLVSQSVRPSVMRPNIYNNCWGYSSGIDVHSWAICIGLYIGELPPAPIVYNPIT